MKANIGKSVGKNMSVRNKYMNTYHTPLATN